MGKQAVSLAAASLLAPLLAVGLGAGVTVLKSD